MAKATLERGMGSLQTVCQPKNDQPYPADAPAACKKGTCKCEWEARWRELGKSRRKLFANKNAGLNHLTNLFQEQLLDTGQTIEYGGEIPLLADFAKEWLNSKINLSDQTRRLYESLLKNNINPYVGSLRIDKITSKHVAALITQLTSGDPKREKQPLGARTLEETIKHVLRPILAYAIKRKLFRGENPCNDQELKTIPRYHRYLPTPGEVHRVATEIKPFWRAAIYVMAGCGLRLHEMIALTPDCIKDDRLHIYRQWLRTDLKYGPLKYDRDETGRWIPLDPVVKSELERHIREYEIAPDQPIFRSPKTPTQPYASGAFEYQLRATVARLGLADKDLTAHNFRHYFASMCVDRGIEIAEVSRMLGHSSIETTYKVYYKMPKNIDRLRMAINGFMSLEIPSNVTVLGAHQLTKQDNAGKVSELIAELKAITGQDVSIHPVELVA